MPLVVRAEGEEEGLFAVPSEQHAKVVVHRPPRAPGPCGSPLTDPGPRLDARPGSTCARATSRLRRSPMGVIIIREMVGTSPKSWSDAARQAVATASRTVRNIRTVEVVKSTAGVEDGEIVEYRVELKIGFEYEGG